MNKIERARKQQFFDFLPGTVGCWSPSAIGVALSEALRGEIPAFYIGRKGSPTASGLRENPQLTVNGEKREIKEYFSTGLTEAYENRRLPEIVIVGCTPDKLEDFSAEFIRLVQGINIREEIRISSHTQQLPIFILVANGIYHQALTERMENKLSKKIGKQKTSVVLEHVLRGTAYVSAEREGDGLDAEYRSEGKGAVVVTGGSSWAREKTTSYSTSSLKLIDGKEDILQTELQKAYTTLMTNVIALASCYDYRRNQPNLNLPVGRILFHRLPTTDGSAYTELEGVRDLYMQTGRSFFEVAQALGAFLDSPTWEDFDEQRFLKPLREGKRTVDFYRHIPSSVQHITTSVRAGRQSSDQFSPSELAVLNPLITYAREYNLKEAARNLEGLKNRIIANIESVCQAYREPQMVDAVPGTIETVLGESRDVSFLKIDSPAAIGISEEEIVPFLAVGTDPKKDGYIIPMSAAVFAYGPEKIFGSVAFITNGAGFAVDFLDQAVAAGIRPGFISDLRLNFEADKFYLVMKMALAANPRIKTIAINVLSTLTTAKDVAIAIDRVVEEHPNLQFVVKLEAGNQREGLEILRSLQKQKKKIVFADTQESLIRNIRNIEGLTPDRLYGERNGQVEEPLLGERLRQAFEKKIKFLLIPEVLSIANAQEITVLENMDLMKIDAVFGQEFRPTFEGKIFVGNPIIVIYGYGKTSLIQAKLIKRAGTEVVIVHPKATVKIENLVRDELNILGIPVMSQLGELHTAVETHYSDSHPQILGIVYEPYSPGVETTNGTVAFRERVEAAMRALVSLKTNYGLALRSVLIPTEMVPTSTTKILLQLARENGIWFIGPNAPGATRTYENFNQQLKQGQIPQQVVAPGNILASGVSGTILFETLAVFKKNGLGISAAISLGGDKTRGLSARDAALMAEKDPRTKYFVYLGEPGGVAAQELAEVMRAGLITKPVITKIIGRSLPDNCYVGHSGSVIYGNAYERAQAKIDALEQAGAIVVNTPEQMVQVIKYLEAHPQLGQIDVNTGSFLQAKKMLEAAQELATQAIKNVMGE